MTTTPRCNVITARSEQCTQREGHNGPHTGASAVTHAAKRDLEYARERLLASEQGTREEAEAARAFGRALRAADKKGAK